MLESVKNRDAEREKFLFDYELTDQFKGQLATRYVSVLRETAYPSIPGKLSRHRF